MVLSQQCWPNPKNPLQLFILSIKPSEGDRCVHRDALGNRKIEKYGLVGLAWLVAGSPARTELPGGPEEAALHRANSSSR